MKILLLFTWITFAGSVYLGYQFYQRTLADQSSEVARRADDAVKIALLQDQVVALQGQLNEEKNKSHIATDHVSATSPSVPVSSSVSIAPFPVAMTFPTTITTVMTARTYEGCRLDRAYPDGLSIFYNGGVAKIPFKDLDPDLAARYGYNPDAAAKFAQDEADRSAQSDQARADYTAHQDTSPQPEIASQTSIKSSTLSDGERISIQIQIKGLQDEIAEMAKQQNSYSSGRYTHGGYTQRIQDDHALIAVLQAKLK